MELVDVARDGVDRGVSRPTGMRRAVDVWAGIECSYNRIGDRYVDQVARSGGYERTDDLERLAGLGVTAIRFPVVIILPQPVRVHS